MSAAELVVMAAVICVSLAVMVALPFLAEHQPDRGRSLSGKQRRGSVHGGIHIGHARDAGPEDDTRATQIQTSLIKSGYLTGEASGHWDAGTEAAMQKFQSDNGWQTKLIPDSRAIIKLGLGPAQDSSQSSSAAATSGASSASGFMPR